MTTALRIALSAALLSALYSYFEYRALAIPWRAAQSVSLVGGAVLALVGLGVQWLKWHRVLVAVRPGSTRKESLVSLLGGFCLGALSPGRLGELGRAVFLPDHRVAASAGAFVDRLSSFVATVALGLAGLWVADPALAMRATLAMAVALGTIVLARTWGHLPDWRFVAPLRNRLAEGREAVGRLSPRHWSEVAAWSLLFNAVFLAQFYVFARAWGPLPDTVIPTIPAIFALKALLPVGFMDLGVREGAAVYFFERLGLDPAIGLAAALLVFSVNVLAPAMVGLVVWPRPGMTTQGTDAGRGGQGRLSARREGVQQGR